MLTQKEEGKREIAKIDPNLERGGKESVRTVTHGRHFPNLPGGNVGIKRTLLIKDP